MEGKIDISVVIPVYQAEQTIAVLIDRITECLNTLNIVYDVILVDDGSKDGTWSLVKEKVEDFQCVKGIKLSRNFGQHNAISAGLNFASGERIVVMDCDLQDLPEEIPNLYRKAIEGFDVVVGQRINRSDKPFKVWFSKVFYKVFTEFTGLSLESGVGNFGIYSRRVIKAVLKFQEGFRPFPIIVKIVGFRRTGLEIKHGSRLEGKSNYTSFSLFSGAINTVLYYSNKPIWIFFIVGLGMVAFIFFLGLCLTLLTLNISTLHLISTLIVLLSLVSLNIAMVGIYVSRIFIEIKKRPSYIVEEVI